MYSKTLELTRCHKCSHALSSIASMFMVSKRLDPKSGGLSNTCAMILLSIKQHPLKTAWAAYYNKKQHPKGDQNHQHQMLFLLGPNDPSKCVAKKSQDFWWFLYLFKGPPGYKQRVDPRCKGHTATEIPPDGAVLVCWKPWRQNFEFRPDRKRKLSWNIPWKGGVPRGGGSLIFPKVPQSFLGILRVPQLPPPLNTPP